MKHHIDHRNEHHSFAALRQGLVVLRQTSILTQPGKGALNNPSFRQHHKAVQCATLDDFNEAAGPTPCPVNKPPGIATVGEDQLHSSKTRPQSAQQKLAAVSVLNVGRMDEQGHDQADGIDDQMTLAAKDFLARIVSAVAPFSAVFTDWLSMMPTLGVGLRPALRRT